MPTRKNIFTKIKEFVDESKTVKKQSTDRTTWKKFERRVATDFGTFRTPLSGMVKSMTGSDTLHPKLYIECKLKGTENSFPFWEKLHLGKVKGKMNAIVIGELLIIPREDFFQLRDKALEEIELNVIAELNVYKSILSLYADTKTKAVTENKIPLLTLQKKEKKGYMIGVHPSDLEEIQKIITNS